MNIPRWSLFTLLCAVLINNLVWLLRYEEVSRPADAPVARVSPATGIDCESTVQTHNKVNPGNSKILNIATIERTNEGDIQVAAITAPNVNQDALQKQPSPLEFNTVETDVRIEESQTFISEHNLARDYYFSAGTEDRLKTIQSLSPQGEDLALIKTILAMEDDSALRLAAVSRLTYEHNFAATNTLIKALDDPATEVRLMALNTIVKNADRSLTPLLRDKMETMPHGSIRDEFKKSIHQLEYSVVMDMDELPDG